MKVLSLETSCRRASLATHVADGGRLERIGESALPAHLRTARSLAPATQRLLAESGWQPADVTLVAVSIGPGSFTGLRIGVTSAKTFAYATEAYSRIRELSKNQADRRSLLTELISRPPPPDDRVDPDEYLDILAEAIGQRNGWKAILKRCVEQASS